MFFLRYSECIGKFSNMILGYFFYSWIDYYFSILLFNDCMDLGEFWFFNILNLLFFFFIYYWIGY